LTGVGALLVVAFLLPWLIFKGALWIGSLGEQVTPATVPAAAAPSPEQPDSDSGPLEEDSPDEDPLEEDSSDEDPVL
jgi:hypothetical protein